MSDNPTMPMIPLSELGWREQVATRLARIEQSIEDMKKILLGNGQPGALIAMDTRVRELESSRVRSGALGDLDMRLRDLETSRARSYGAMTVIGGIAATIMAVLFRLFDRFLLR